MLANISSLAFGGPDLRTAYLGCLLGDSIARFAPRSPGIRPRIGALAACRAAHAHGRRTRRVDAPSPRGSRVDAAYQAIRARILDNVWPPGYRALEQELAHALGMSRTPVREALIRLAKEGLVEVVPRHGMRVLPVSPTTCATSTRC